MANRDVVVVGDIVCDDWRFVARKSHNPENAVLCLSGSSSVIAPGGAGLTALFLQQLGARVTLFSRVDNSDYAQRVLEILREWGVDISYVEHVNHWKMPLKTRYVSDETILVRHDSEEYPPTATSAGRVDTNVFESVVSDAQCVVVSDYDKGYLYTKRLALVRAARRQNVPIFVDCKGQHIAEYGDATGFKINAKAALAFARGFNRDLIIEAEKDPCAFVYNENRPQFVIMTQGADGAEYHINGKTYSEESPDPQFGCHAVGAGDAFMAGAVMWMMLCNTLHDIKPDDVRSAVVAGHLTAIERVKSNGAQLSGALLISEYCRSQFKAKPHGKIVSSAVFETFSRAAGNAGKTVVFTNGCFDVLHAGHLHLLHEAKKRGDILVVALDSDENVRRLKGSNRPVQDEQTRAKILAAMDIVDAVTVFTDTDENTRLRDLIRHCRPHYLVKGGDYTPSECVGWEEMTQRKKPGRVICCPLLPGVSTTTIINKVKGANV